jgi:cell shape-determining protein MreC
MRSLRFNHVFLALMALALVSALGFTRWRSDTLRASAQAVFVTQPVRALGSAVRARFERSPKADTESPPGVTRTYREIVEENSALRVATAHLAAQLEQLREVNAERTALGSLRHLCRPMRVTGTDASLRRSLLVQGRLDGLRPGMAVIHASGLVGKLERVGWSGGAQVQLITDRGFRATIRFLRLEEGQPRMIGSLSGLVEGDGRDAMLVRNLSMRETSEARLAPGDLVVLSDREYPQPLQGYRVGVVASVAESRTYPLFAEVIVKPVRDPQRLQEVQVVLQ